MGTKENVAHGHTIDSLIEKLSELREIEGGDTPIVMELQDCSSDNCVVGLDGGVEVVMYYAECTWDGEVYMTEEDRQSREDPDGYAEAPEDSIRAICISPIN